MRRVSVYAKELTVSALSDRHFVGPWGLFGGKEGGTQAFRVKRVGDTEFRTFSEAFGLESPTKFDNVKVHEGDELLLEAPGGGGYGDPLERAPARVLADVLDRNVTREAAESAYGVVLAASNGSLAVDEAATEALRTCMRATRPAPPAAPATVSPSAVAAE